MRCFMHVSCGPEIVNGQVRASNPVPEAWLVMWGGVLRGSQGGSQDARELRTNESCIYSFRQKCGKWLPVAAEERLGIWIFHSPAFKLEEDKRNGVYIFLKLAKVRVRDKDDEAKSQSRALTYLFLEIICVYLLFSILIKFKIG